MRIAISGASGLLGSTLAGAFQQDGHEVLRLVRHEAQAPGEASWDPAAGSIDTAALAGIDAIVNMSGATIGRRWTAARRREILDSRVQTTELLARTVAALDPRPAAFLCAGGIGIYGDTGDDIATEETPTGEGFLAEVGKAWEAAAEPARTAGVRTVSMRQGIVLTRRGGALAKMLPPFRLGVGGRVGSGRQWWSWIGLEDYVRAVRFLLGSDLSGPVNVTSPEPVTNRRFTKALGKALGRPTVFPVPAAALRAVYGRMADETLLTGQRALPARLLEAGFTFEHPDVEDALRRALEE